MEVFYRKVSVALGSNVTLPYVLPLPVIRRLLFYGPALDCGFRLFTPKRTLVPVTDGDEIVRGCGAVMDFALEQTIDEKPYRVSLYLENNDAAAQIMYFGFVLAPVERSEIELLQEILGAIQGLRPLSIDQVQTEHPKT